VTFCPLQALWQSFGRLQPSLLKSVRNALWAVDRGHPAECVDDCRHAVGHAIAGAWGVSTLGVFAIDFFRDHHMGKGPSGWREAKDATKPTTGRRCYAQLLPNGKRRRLKSTRIPWAVGRGSILWVKLIRELISWECDCRGDSRRAFRTCFVAVYGGVRFPCEISTRKHSYR
jgi:hypothetical protein